MGSLIRATTCGATPTWSASSVVTPQRSSTRFHIPAGVEHQEDAFISFESLRSHAGGHAPRSWLARTSGFAYRAGRACDILGPIAVIARNAQTVLGRDGGDRALSSTSTPRP